jgi:hypothetical protein
VYDRLKCEIFKDYHLAYLKTDVLLLADVFTRFRETCLDYYELDPANYLSAPGLAWDAMLKMTKVELELISDPEMFNMMDRMKRGGLCFVGSMRHVKANNKYLEDYDPSKPSTYIMYWDANNLYGWAMIQPLPYAGLEFDTNTTLEQILETADDHEYGYNVEVDFHFPIDTHDKLKQFPPAPENLTPDIEWFSEFQRKLGEEKEIIGNGKYHGSNKLVPHLFEHKNYVIHYRNLKYLVKLGAVITKVHRVLKFKQKAWLKPYIDFNTQKRAEAKNDFEKDFFKLMNNAVFGKSCEDVKNRIKLHISTDDKNMIKWATKTTFKKCTSFKGVHLMEMYNLEIKANKPAYVGMSVLDLSKLHMMSFHYDVIQEQFGEKAKLIYSDTDSLVYCLEHPDIYEWVKDNREYFDLSDSARPDMKDNTNKKVIGKFKDEMNGLLNKEITSLNPKVYSIIHQHIKEKKQIVDVVNPQTGNVGFTVKMEETYEENHNTKKVKGISKVVVKKDLHHPDFRRVIESKIDVQKKVMNIQSFNHQLFTQSQTKVALTTWYDKMQMVDSINNVPFGYMGSNP